MPNMTTTIIKCFRDDFDRFYDMLLTQIEICPDELWAVQEGGYPYWQQILHAVAITELYALPEGTAPRQKRYSMSVAMLSEATEDIMGKAELKALAEDVRQSVYTFLEGMTAEKLMAVNEKTTRLLKKETLYMNTLIALVRHLSYHIGCCDTILRYHGMKGVY